MLWKLMINKNERGKNIYYITMDFTCDAINNRTPSSLHAHSVEYALSVVLE